MPMPFFNNNSWILLEEKIIIRFKFRRNLKIVNSKSLFNKLEIIVRIVERIGLKSLTFY
jgi:hypothetical protein